jgi:hypothetical protein
MTDLQALKQKRDQLTARIQKAEARLKAGRKKEDDRVKILVGAAILDQVKRGEALPQNKAALLKMMDGFLTRESERDAVLEEDGSGSAIFHRLTRFDDNV